MGKVAVMTAFTNIIGTLATVDAFSLSMPSQSLSIKKWNETTKYNHTLNDLIKIRDGVGDVYIYHGAPEEYAEQIIVHGPQVPYSVEELGREVAAKYGVPWVTFRKYTYRVGSREVFTRLSTAPALIAFRWASSFKQGEVLTDLNSHARMLKEARRIAFAKHISIDNAYEQVLNDAEQAAKVSGIHYSTGSSADHLKLADLYPRSKQTGAIVQFKVHASVLTRAAYDAGYYIEETESKKYGNEPILSWNDSYVDIKVAPEDILSKAIVVSGIPYLASDAVHDAMKTHEFDRNTGRILGLKKN